MSFSQLYYGKLDETSGEWKRISFDEPFVTDGRYRIEAVLKADHWSDSGSLNGADYTLGSTFTLTINNKDYPTIEFVAPTTGAGAKTKIDWMSTYYAYWNATNKNWVIMQDGDTFKEGTLYKCKHPSWPKTVID